MGSLQFIWFSLHKVSTIVFVRIKYQYQATSLLLLFGRNYFDKVERDNLFRLFNFEKFWFEQQGMVLLSAQTLLRVQQESANTLGMSVQTTSTSVTAVLLSSHIGKEILTILSSYTDLSTRSPPTSKQALLTMTNTWRWSKLLQLTGSTHSWLSDLKRDYLQ